MGWTVYVLILAEIVMLGHESYALCKRCNLSQMFGEGAQSRLQYYRGSRNSPAARDTSYLPEEDYIEEHESKQGDPMEQLDRDNRNLMPEYRNLCEIVTKRVQLADNEYEYQPPHYHEIFCKSYSLLHENERPAGPSKQKCVHPGFHCVQRSRTLFLLRRPWDSDCWEPFTKEIASGCDCMWPVSVLGEITGHY